MTTWKVFIRYYLFCTAKNPMSMSQVRLAASRNANDESEVDESLLHVGLFTYPILQAADIMAYK
jgi:tryptophanyl-tRNA synthetase